MQGLSPSGLSSHEKSKQSEVTVFFFLSLCQQVFLSFAAHSTGIRCSWLNSTGGATCQIDRVINNGTKQRPAQLQHCPGTGSHPRVMRGVQEPKDTHLTVQHNQCCCRLSQSNHRATIHTHTRTDGRRKTYPVVYISPRRRSKAKTSQTRWFNIIIQPRG